MTARTAVRIALGLAVVGVGSWDLLFGTAWGRRLLVHVFDDAYAGSPAVDPGPPVFDAGDETMPRIDVQLVAVARNLDQPTDLVVTRAGHALVAGKKGDIRCLDLATGVHKTFAQVDVVHNSELGLLGLALHPRWPDDPRLYVSRTVAGGRAALSQIVVHRLDAPLDPCSGGWSPAHVLIEVDQPYGNHDGGQIRFGPDGMLYWSLGDGGFRNDPHGAGQDTASLLGKLLRLDVSGRRAQAPKDNPFAGRGGFAPEIWALGLRNPWRFDILPDGSVLLGDVGQDTWEEVDRVRAGDNLGWKVVEGPACFEPPSGCATEGFVPPVWSYGRQRGVSVTGGVVGRATDALTGQFVFGDFATGRLWALPADGGPVAALGRWQLTPSAFARDDEGRILLLDFHGAIWRIAAPRAP